MQSLGKSVGQKIVKLREERNLSAKDLASMTNKSQSYISKIETGNVKNPRKETLVEILKGLELDQKEIKQIITEFYDDENYEIKKVEDKIFVKKESSESESNPNFIQNFEADIRGKQSVKLPENEEIVWKQVNRNELSIELTTIAHQLQETAKSLNSRTMLDVRYDSIKNSVNQASDRLELFKLNYGIYVEKLIRDGHKVQA